MRRPRRETLRARAPWFLVAAVTAASLSLLLWLRAMPPLAPGAAGGSPRAPAREAAEGEVAVAEEGVALPVAPRAATLDGRERAPRPAVARSQPALHAAGPALPSWLHDALGPETKHGGDAPVTNRQRRLSGAELGAGDLLVLQDLIDQNRLTESSSGSDHDDGNGVFEPWEVGYQVWSDGRLVALAFGPDRFSSYYYEIRELPASIGGLDALRYLDVHGQALEALPAEVGALGALRELYAFDNRLATLPHEIGSLAALRILVVSRNRLASLPASIGALSSLQQLYLADNPLRQLAPALGGLHGLRLLNIARTHAPSAGGAGHADLAAVLAPLGQLDTLYVTSAETGVEPPGLLRDGTISSVYFMAQQAR